MREKTIFSRLKKFIPFIIIFCLLASLFVNYWFLRIRIYTASVVINYNYDSAEQGKTPAGDKLDVNEIKSSLIMSKVIDALGLSGTYSVDNLTSRVSITAVPDSDKQAQKESAIDNGEEVVYEPTTYIIAFTATNAEGPEFAGKIVDEVVENYFSVFSEKYINVDYISNKLDKIYENNYDYLQMMEYIETCIDDTVNLLYQRDYRSTETGMSFEDLVDEFNYLRNTKISDLFSTIYKYQITKNKDLLINSYLTRIDNNGIESQKQLEMLDDVMEVIDRYVEKMRDSGNTNITHDYILQDIYDHLITDGDGNTISGDMTVTYDQLIYAMRDHSLNDKLAIIDSAYCKYVIEQYQRCTGNCNGQECAHSNLTCTQLSDPNYANIEAEVTKEISELVDDLSELYNITKKTNDEYNEHLGCENIETLSTVSTTASINVKTYSIIAFAFFMLVCCGGAILIIRLNDIINRNFFIDRLTNFHNRAFLDRYLKKEGSVILDDDNATVSISITNQRTINQTYGRETGDQIIAFMAENIRAAFASIDAEFIYNDNSHFVVLARNTDYIAIEATLETLRVALDERVKYENICIKYKAGSAQTYKDSIRSARKLLVKAIESGKKYIIESKEI